MLSSERMSTVRTLLQLDRAGSPSPPRYTTCQKVTLVHYKERCDAIEGAVLPCKRTPRFCCKCCTAPHCQRRECVVSEKKPCNYNATCTLTKNALQPGSERKSATHDLELISLSINICVLILRQHCVVASEHNAGTRKEICLNSGNERKKINSNLYRQASGLLSLCMIKGESKTRKFSQNINTLFPPGAIGNLRET